MSLLLTSHGEAFLPLCDLGCAGYELLNEPWAGDIYRHLDQLETRMLVTAISNSLLSHSSDCKFSFHLLLEFHSY